MLLMSPSAASSAIGAKCGGSSPSDEDAGLIAILRLLTTKVEGAIETESLALTAWNDRVRLDTEYLFRSAPLSTNLQSAPGGIYDVSYARSPARAPMKIRLANAFVQEDTVKIIDPLGVEVTAGTYPGINIDIDCERGVIEMDQWRAGVYRIAYVAGFSPTAAPQPLPADYDPDNAALQDIPDWIKLIVVTMLIQWYRGLPLVPKGVKGMDQNTLLMAIHKAVYTAIHSKFMRPRMDVVWADARRA